MLHWCDPVEPANMLATIYKGLSIYDLTYPSGRVRTMLWACSVVARPGESSEAIQARQRNAQLSTDDMRDHLNATGWMRVATRRVRRVVKAEERSWESISPADAACAFMPRARRRAAVWKYHERHPTEGGE